MTIEEKIGEDVKSAMKAGEKERLQTLRSLRAALKNEAISKGEHRGALDDQMAIAVLSREAKRRQESIEQFKAGEREDLAEREEAQLAIIQEYLPERLSEEEVRAQIETIAAEAEEKEFGAVMKKAMEKMRGQADGKLVAEIVKDILS